MPVRAISGRINKSAKRFLRRSVRSQTHSTPPPVKGWNARDALASMAQDEAIVLDNWYPEETYVRIRRGYEEHASGMTGDVESVMAYRGPSTNKQFAANDGSVYEVTSSGAVGAAEFDSMTSDRWQDAMFGTSAGNYLYIVNGSDAPRYYDGTSWTTPTITGSGLTATDLIHVNVFKNRLFFVEKDTLSFWYFPVSTIAGAITEFRLDGYFKKGGYLVATGTWTRDGGDGLDDLFVAVTSVGECAVFQGTDPGDSSAWSLIGIFEIGPPLGRRCMFKVGSDIVVMTEDGFSFLSKLLQGARLTKLAAQSDRISHAVHDAVRLYKSQFGWQPIFHPSGNMMLFNIPKVNAGASVQFVSNSTTGAWCRFTGMDALCWTVCGNNCLWFGGTDGKVYKADTGGDDGGSNIETSVSTAFIYFGPRGLQKTFKGVRPNLLSDAQIDISVRVNVDYEEETPTSTSSTTGIEGAEWDAEDWDVASWGGGLEVTNKWITATGVGNVASLRMDLDVSNVELQWNATDWLYEVGGFI